MDVNPQLRICLPHIQDDHIRWVNSKPNMAAEANLLHSTNFRQRMLNSLSVENLTHLGSPWSQRRTCQLCAALKRMVQCRGVSATRPGPAGLKVLRSPG